MDRFFCENKKTFVWQLAGGILFLCVMFFSIDKFNEPEVYSKWYAFLLVGLTFCCIFFITTDHLTFSLDKFTCALAVLVLYILIRNSISYTGIVSLLAPFVFFCLFICFRSFPTQLQQNMSFIVIFVCVLQAIYGILQYCGIFHVYNNFFTVIGSFENPGGFAACLSAGFPFCLILFQSTRKHFITGILILIIILTAVSLSGSRAGILSIVITSLAYFAIHYFKRLRKKKIWIWGSLFLLILLGTLLFFLKKDSAIGRLLIWQNSISMIKDKPIWGHGTGGFSAHYMEYQAHYFEKNPESKYSLLADNVNYPFNDYLLITLEYGLIGLCLLVIVLFMVFKISNAITISHFCFLTVGLFACFSYPMKYPFVLLVLAYSLATITRETNKIRLTVLAKALFTGLLLTGIIMTSRDIYFETRWRRLIDLSSLGKTQEILPEYTNLYQQWNHNALFLYNYGALLNHTEHYTQSNLIMQECKTYFNDHDVQLLIADNHYNQKEWKSAEESYLTASYMCPNRLAPLYGLFSMHRKKGEIKQAKAIGLVILNKPIKIMSKAVYDIKQEVSDFMKVQEVL